MELKAANRIQLMGAVRRSPEKVFENSARFGKSALGSGCSNTPNSSVLEDMVMRNQNQKTDRLLSANRAGVAVHFK